MISNPISQALPESATISSLEKSGSIPIHFYGLNGLRGIAATTVFLVHAELIKAVQRFPNVWNDQAIVAAERAVTFFFVLSGFLITYLLLHEQNQRGKINIKAFYYRRILRIWPLYFLFVLIGIVSLDMIDKTVLNTIVLYLFFLPNLAIAFGTFLPNAYMVWSIGVEEQFYFIWPWVLKFSSHFVAITIFLTLTLIFLRNGIPILTDQVDYPATKDYLNAITRFAEMTTLGAMAIGGLAAHALYFKSKFILGLLLNKITFYVALTLVVVFVLRAVTVSYVNNEVYSILFVILIVNIGLGKIPLFKLLDSKVFLFLGKISFGIYMYNLIILQACMDFYNLAFKPKFNLLYQHILYSGISYGLTILVAWVSFHYFERRFLNLKISRTE